MRLLWLDINASFSHSSLAIPALHAQISEDINNKIEWQKISGTIKSDPNKIISDSIALMPDYIFSTLWLFNHTYVVDTLKKIKAIRPDIKIVLGGPEFLGDCNQFLQANREVEAVFRGEGEEVFPIFIERILNSESWKNLPGFAHLESNKYIDNQVVRVANFENLNIPESSKFFSWEKAFVQIESSRGCFNSCAFCVSGGELDNNIKNISIENIAQRIENIKEHGIREVRVLDRTFNALNSRSIQMLNLFRKYHNQICFHLEIHPALISAQLKELLLTLPKGLIHIEAGIQSLDNRVLECSKRKGDKDSALAGVQFLVNADIAEVHTDLIAGLPLYHYRQLLKDLKVLIQSGADEIQLELLKLLPGTEMRRRADELGIKYSPIPPYEVLETREISYRELTKCKVLSKILDNWYNSKEWCDSFAKISNANETFEEQFTESLLSTDFLIQPMSLESKGLTLYNFCKQFYPEYLDYICLDWIKCGLSLKKEPAQKAKIWKIGNESIKNPILDASNRDISYLYYRIENAIHWFSYDKSKNRTKPTNHIICQID